MTDQAEVKISGAMVRAALADEATTALPEGPLKVLVQTLAAGFAKHTTSAVAELVLRYPRLGQGHERPWDQPSASSDDPGEPGFDTNPRMA